MGNLCCKGDNESIEFNKPNQQKPLKKKEPKAVVKVNEVETKRSLDLTHSQIEDRIYPPRDIQKSPMIDKPHVHSSNQHTNENEDEAIRKMIWPPPTEDII